MAISSKVSEINDEEEEEIEEQVVDLKSGYYSSLTELQRHHRRLFNTPVVVYSVRESEIGVFHSAAQSNRILTVVARCPYKASRSVLESAAYKSYCFLRSFVGNLHKCQGIISVTSNCLTFNDKTRLYKIFYGYHHSSLSTRFSTGDVTELSSFAKVKKSIDFDFNTVRMNELFQADFENTSSRVIDLVNFIIIYTVFAPRANQIKRHWKVNRLMKVLMPRQLDSWIEGEGEMPSTVPHPNFYRFE